MLNPKVWAPLLAGIFLVYQIYATATLHMPPPPSSPGYHSYSGRVMGHRAIAELSAALGLPVQRHRAPLLEFFEREPSRYRLLMIQPDMRKLSIKDNTLAKLGAWIRRGGECVLVSAAVTPEEAVRRMAYADPYADPEEIEADLRENFSSEEWEVAFGTDLLDVLGLEDLSVAFPEPGEADADRPEDEAWILRRRELNYERAEVQLAADATGSLQHVATAPLTLGLPAQAPRGFRGASAEQARGQLTVTASEAGPVPIALEFGLEKGSITFVSEPALFQNAGISQNDNAIAAFRLAAGSGNRTLVIDEYLHGLFPEGDPRALFSAYPFGVILLFMLGAAGTWAWSQGIRFGPPLADPPPPRRSIIEYVEAMARLFRRSRKRRIVLQTLRDGLLADLRSALHMPHGAPVENIAAKLAYAQPAAAERLTQALNNTDAALQTGGAISEKTLLQLEKELDSCRIPHLPRMQAKSGPPNSMRAPGTKLAR